MKLSIVLALLSGLVPAVAVASDPKINDNHPSIIYSTVGDEGTGPTWFMSYTTDSTPKDYMNDEHYSNFTTTPVF